MTHALSDQLVRVLKRVDRPGTFCAVGGGAAPLPGLEVAGLGPVGLPLTAAQAPELKKRCEQAPYGRGTETIVDTSVRRVWRLEPDRFALTNPDWAPHLAGIVRAVQRELGLEEQALESHPYNLLVYEPGGFFLPHRDGEKLDRMVATLVVVLPSSFQGGELVVRHEGRERVVDFGAAGNPFHTHFVAFYADCEHEVRPLREGHRLCLVYNLTLAKAGAALAAPRTAGLVDEAAAVLRAWSADGPRKLAVPLGHRYTEGGLVWDALKGVDREKARVLNEAAGRAGCAAHLALLTFHESGPAEESYAPRRRRRRWDEDEGEEDPNDYEMSEVFDSSLTAAHWSDAAGARPLFGEMLVRPEEIVPPEALTKVKPDVDVSGYTGNEGLTLNRWYRHAVIVLWPVAHQFDALCDCGTPSAVAALGEWVARWENAPRTEAKALKAQCIDFAGRIVERWERGHWRPGGAGARGGLLAAVVRLSDARLTGLFLAHVVAADPSVEIDESLTAVLDEHGWDTFRTALTTVMDATTAETLERNVRLLDHLCAGKTRLKGARLAVCQSLAEKVMAGLEAIDREDVEINWRVRGVNRAEVLAGLARALIAAEQFELLSLFVTRTLGAPRAYPLLAHVLALTHLGPWLKKHVKKPCEPVARWLAACNEQLEALTTTEPTPPVDLRREANVRCDCADCKELKTFLKDPVERAHRFRVRQDRRQHIENAIRTHGCDASCVTDRSGSPQTLVCTKTTASFEARLKKYREDLAHLAALRAIQKGLPG